jgi:hypothetical protein
MMGFRQTGTSAREGGLQDHHDIYKNQGVGPLLCRDRRESLDVTCLEGQALVQFQGCREQG